VSTYLLTPGAATSTTAELSAALLALDERPRPPAATWIEERRTGRRTPIASWDEWLVPDASAGVLSARVTLTGLASRARETVDLVVDDAIVASAEATAMPDRLPGVGEKPLTIMLGSCFCAAEDRIGRVGRRFATLPGALVPDLKLLCGDQVYLDAPFHQFLRPHSRQGLAETFLRRYHDTWTQSGDDQGFRQVLSTAAALFTADDHEFWNNAPFPSFAVNTWTSGGRRAWWDLSSALFAAFQNPQSSAVRQVDVGVLSLFMADTRVHRGGDRRTFLEPAEMQALKNWCGTLAWPGVLVLGQPAFAAKAGWRGHIADWNLPDFDQYAELCEAVLGAPQAVIMVTGDVHYGRVAQVLTSAGHEVLEVIASPMSLVTAGGAREWKSTPAMFPDEAIPGLVRHPIQPLATWQRAADHFLTLEFWQAGDRLEMRIRTWETTPDAGTPAAPVFEYAIQRRT
jgi:hypothetical protein